MSWIESHHELINHPKTLLLAQAMGWNKYEAVGRLHAFWFFVMDYAPTGDLRKFNAKVLAEGVGLDHENADAFVEAMVGNGWIDRSDGVFRVHDWPEYAGRYLKNYKFKRRPELYLEMLRLYGLDGQTVRDKSETNDGHVRDLSATCPRFVGRTNQPTNQPDQQDQQEKISLHVHSHVEENQTQRESAMTEGELLSKDFILRPDEREFVLFVQSIRRLIIAENATRRANPFEWKPRTGSLESDLRLLCYKVKDDVKIKILTNALNVLKYRYNWLDYVALGIKATIRATAKNAVRDHYAYTVDRLKHPNELVSAASDGNLSKPIDELIKKVGLNR
jgi:hypothetical protein